MSQPGTKLKYSVGCKTSKTMKKISKSTNQPTSQVAAIQPSEIVSQEHESEDRPKAAISDYYNDMVDPSEVVEEKNLCIGCGVDMGRDNPRQYCRKTYCPHEK
jgi:hypothetical protein